MQLERRGQLAPPEAPASWLSDSCRFIIRPRWPRERRPTEDKKSTRHNVHMRHASTRTPPTDEWSGGQERARAA